MGKTIIEKIIGNHAGRAVSAGDMVDVTIDARVARDFGGANVVRNLQVAGLLVADPRRTYFTFDCNPGGSDQKYAANQHACRRFAREQGIAVYDVDTGIGTHLAMDLGLVGPGETLVSTDSHANILGAIGAFGQGMGDQDIAHAFAYGTVWFKVPPTVRIRLEGQPGPHATPKDVTLALVKHFGANGLLGYAAELYGPYVDRLGVAGRITMASMCTEMGGIIMLFPPSRAVIDYCEEARTRAGVAADLPVGRSAVSRPSRSAAATAPVYSDPDATYEREVTIDIGGLGPLLARPGQPEDVVPVAEAAGTKIDSVFIGSCTNGRYEDVVAAARVLKGRRVAPGVVLKVVPATDAVWRRLLGDGVILTLKEAGTLLSNAGCAGCAEGQIGQNGPGEVTVSTGNRNFPGKQGKGSVYLASPETAAASAIAGVITTVDAIPAEPALFTAATKPRSAGPPSPAPRPAGGRSPMKPTTVKGRAWVVRKDNIDTDMIYHNRHLTVTDPAQMGQLAFGNLPGWEDFAKKARPGDILVTGKNFGCGSSRQQAVDCFQALGVAAIVAESFGAIYERNAINAGLAILRANLVETDICDGEELEVDFRTGTIRRASGQTIGGQAFSDAQMKIYQRGGLLVKGV